MFIRTGDTDPWSSTAGHCTVAIAHTIAPARSLLSYYKSCLVALKPSPDDSTLWAWGSGQHCCSTVAALQAVRRARCGGPLSAQSSLRQPLPRLKFSPSPVSSASSTVGRSKPTATALSKLGGAPRWMLLITLITLITLVNWLVRRDGCC